MKTESRTSPGKEPSSQAQLELLETAINSSSISIAISDARKPDMPLVFVNAAFERLTGYRFDEIIGKNCRFLQGPDTDRGEVRAIREAIAAGKHHTGLILNYRKDGSAFWNELTLSPVVGEGELLYYIAVQNDISVRVAQQTQLASMAYLDPLTGLANRTYFKEVLQQKIASGEQCAVLFIDLDRFKSINDRFGHEAGDELLIEVAERLRCCVRPRDRVARLAGDEFTVIISRSTKKTEERVAARIIASLGKPYRLLHAHDAEVAASIGIARFPEHGGDAESLLRQADAAMYRAKRGGGAGYVHFEPVG